MTSIFLSIILVFMAFSAESWKLPKSSAGFLIIHRGSSAISHQFLNILVSDNDLKAKHNVKIDHYLELRQSVWEVNISNSIVDTRPRAGENVKFDLMQISGIFCKVSSPFIRTVYMSKAWRQIFRGPKSWIIKTKQISFKKLSRLPVFQFKRAESVFIAKDLLHRRLSTSSWFLIENFSLECKY